MLNSRKEGIRHTVIDVLEEEEEESEVTTDQFLKWEKPC